MGALTSKPYAFTARSWELKTVESVDFFSAEGVSVAVQIRGSEILRVLPVPEENNPFPFISDKIRFFYDSLNIQRITQPLVRSTLVVENLKDALNFIPVSFKIASAIFQKAFIADYFSSLENKRTFSIFSSLSSFSSLQDLLVLKQFLPKMGAQYTFSSLKEKDFVFFNDKEVEDAQNYVFVNFNPRLEAPLLSLALKKKKANFFSLGVVSATFKTFSLGVSSLPILEMKHPFIKKLLQREKTVFFFGSSSLLRSSARFNYTQLKTFIHRIHSLTNSTFIHVQQVPAFISTMGALLDGSVSRFTALSQQFDKATNWFFVFSGSKVKVPFDNMRTVYFGTHGSEATKQAAIVFPIATPFESDNSFFTLDNNFKSVRKVTDTPWEVRSLFSLLSSFYFLKPLASFPVFSFSSLPFLVSDNFLTSLVLGKQKGFINSFSQPFVHNFYRTGSIANYSKNLSLASYRFRKQAHSFKNR